MQIVRPHSRPTSYDTYFNMRSLFCTLPITQQRLKGDEVHEEESVSHFIALAS